MKPDNKFSVSTLINPVRFILWLGALFLSRAAIHYWVRQSGSEVQTITEHYVRAFNIKIPLFTKIINHLPSENTKST